jgi:Ca2+-binding RTX toxin-like protein
MSARTRLTAIATAALVATGLTVLAGAPANAVAVAPTVGCLNPQATPEIGNLPPAVPVGILGLHLITGTANNDVLVGTTGADLILGLGGNDIINGLGGDDVVYGGPGNDIVFGGTGRDCLEGNDGNDTLWGNEDGDTLYGDQGADTLYGNKGADHLFGYDAVGVDAFDGRVVPVNVLDGGEDDDDCTTGGYFDFGVEVSCQASWIRY